MLPTHLNKITISASLYASIFLSSSASAQIVDREKFEIFIASPMHQQLIATVTSKVPSEILTKCTALQAPPGKITVVKPVNFASDGTPNTGAWWERLPISGCGNDTSINILFEVAPDGVKINSYLTAPGITHASMILQKDAMQYALIAIHSKASDCNGIQLKNTRFESYGSKNSPTPSPEVNAKFHPWWETWTFIGCDKTFDVPLNFAPDDTGVQIFQSSDIITN